jgi:RNA recognition motif-containing protein
MKNCQLAINSLSWATTEQKLRSLFSSIGKVLDVTLIKNPLGDSIGSAFITMSNKFDAETAAGVMDGKEIDGKAVRVVVSSSKEKKLTKAILSDA